MKTPSIRRRLLTLALLSIACATMAFAQIDPLRQLVYQNDRLVAVIYTPARAAGQNTYSEHWVLYPSYVYPGAASQARLKLVPSRDVVPASEAEFFRTAPWGPGFRYIHVVSHETNTLPTR